LYFRSERSQGVILKQTQQYFMNTFYADLINKINSRKGIKGLGVL